MTGLRQVTQNRSEAAAALDEAEYEAIETAVRETTRGRAFLAEFARRNRSLDTGALLESVRRLQLAQQDRHPPAELSHLSRDIMEIATAVARARRDIAAMPAAKETGSDIGGGEFDSIIGWAEKATSDILAATEDIQEISWKLREKGLAPKSCDALDARATDIYTACAFQDLASRRIGAAIAAFNAIEKRLGRLAEVWGLDKGAGRMRRAPAEAAAQESRPAAEESLELFARLATDLRAAMRLAGAGSPDAPAAAPGRGEAPQVGAEAEAARSADPSPAEDLGDEELNENPDLDRLSQAHKTALFS